MKDYRRHNDRPWDDASDEAFLAIATWLAIFLALLAFAALTR